MKIVEAGLVDVWWKKWTHDKVRCPTGSGLRQNMLPLNKLGGVFIIYSVVAGAAILVFLFTTLWECVVKRKYSHG